LIRGSDVVAERKVRLWQSVGLKQPPIRIPSYQIVKATTHGLNDSACSEEEQGRRYRGEFCSLSMSRKGLGESVDRRLQFFARLVGDLTRVADSL